MAGRKPGRRSLVESFDLEPGRILAGKYEVLEKLGQGWEGEVYLIRETFTGIHRAAKCFFPHRNPGDRIARFYARKLHKLRDCPVLIHYHGRETFQHRRHTIAMMVSEYVEGEMLDEFLKRQPGKRLPVYAAAHLLHALASGMEDVHRRREYHGDLHTGNIMVQRFGLRVELKLLDLFHWGSPQPENLRDDVVDMVRVFYDCLGGARHYGHQPDAVKEICRGLKRSLILRRFRTAGALRRYVETLEWA